MEAAHGCDLCGRMVAEVTKHHLIPKSRHKNKRNKKLFDRREIHVRVLWLCRPCHKHVHAVLTEKELETQYNTRELLLAHPEIEKFVNWVRKRPDTHISVRGAKNKTGKWK